MKIVDLFESLTETKQAPSDEPVFESKAFKGQTAVGTVLVAYRAVRQGEKHIITVSSRGKPIGSIIIDGNKISFKDKRGSILTSIEKTFDFLDKRVVENQLIPSLVSMT